MAQVTVYLPDDLRAQAKEAGLNISKLTQAAVRAALGQMPPTEHELAKKRRRSQASLTRNGIVAGDRTVDEARPPTARVREVPGAKPHRGDITTDLAPPADPVGCTKQRHTGPFQRLGYLTRCGGCGRAVRGGGR